MKTLKEFQNLQDLNIKVSEQISDMTNQIHLIFFAVYGFFKLCDSLYEPELIFNPIQTKINGPMINYEQTAIVKVNDKEYPILKDAESTIRNIMSQISQDALEEIK